MHGILHYCLFVLATSILISCSQDEENIAEYIATDKCTYLADASNAADAIRDSVMRDSLRFPSMYKIYDIEKQTRWFRWIEISNMIPPKYLVSFHFDTGDGEFRKALATISPNCSNAHIERID